MRKQNKGFTLIEMIIVIVIIAILAAIAVPAVFRYIEDARDTKLIVQARSVLNQAKAKSIELAAHNKVNTLDKDTTLWKEIVQDAEVDGKLEDLNLNSQKNASGDFILSIGGKYVYYYDDTETFEIKTELDDIATLIQKIHNEMMANQTVLGVIDQYFNKENKGTSIDSEGKNYAPAIKQALRDAGFPVDRVSWRIYYDRNKNKATITISETKLSQEMVGEEINVTQFDYGNQGFTGTYTKKTGVGKVASKTISEQGSSYQVIYLDVVNTTWTDVEK